MKGMEEHITGYSIVVSVYKFTSFVVCQKGIDHCIWNQKPEPWEVFSLLKDVN